jgi:rod shape-determining protein MreD
MKPFRLKLERYFWAAVPTGFSFSLLFIAMLPMPIHGLEHIMPLLLLAPVFYWGISEGREMNFLTVFVLGILSDVATGLPLGFSSLSYVFFLALLQAQRKYIHKEGFVMKWGYFCMLLATTMLLQWLVISIYNGQIMPLLGAFVQWIATIGCYPFLHVLCDGLQARIDQHRWRTTHHL